MQVFKNLCLVLQVQVLEDDAFEEQLQNVVQAAGGCSRCDSQQLFPCIKNDFSYV